jgi:hypothetical protein
MNTLATRTVQTLKYRTDFIQSFCMPELDEAFELRALQNKTRNKHYILIFQNIFLSKKDWDDEKVVAEISVRNSKIRFNIKISKQYPEFANYEKLLEQKISAIIAPDLVTL